MTKILKVLALGATILALSAGSALAANAHFIGTPRAAVSGNTLTVTASIAGLGNAERAEFTLSGPVQVNSVVSRAGTSRRLRTSRRRST